MDVKYCRKRLNIVEVMFWDGKNTEDIIKFIGLNNDNYSISSYKDFSNTEKQTLHLNVLNEKISICENYYIIKDKDKFSFCDAITFNNVYEEVLDE